MPAGTALENTQPAGGSGTAPGPTPPQATTYWLAAQVEVQVHGPPPTSAEQSHVVPPSVVHPHPSPRGSRHETNALIGAQAVRPLAPFRASGQRHSVTFDPALAVPSPPSSLDDEQAPTPSTTANMSHRFVMRWVKSKREARRNPASRA